VGQVLGRMLGLRESYGDVILDPVLPPDLDGLTFETDFEGHALRLSYRVTRGAHTPQRIMINEETLPTLRYTFNPYRTGGAAIKRRDFLARLTRKHNTVDVYL
jgi:1,2-beta-oligoglucan phosphorylase